ncbi:MAG: hypothetical protein ACYS14_01775 [Planctomycetota bacterium]|jgi:hypothetical protein
MALTSDQIAEIERLTDRLKKWQRGQMPRTIKHFSRYMQLLRFIEPQANVVLMDLSASMPDTVRVIHVRLQELLLMASQVDILRQEKTDAARREDCSLLKRARDLVLLLQRIAKDRGEGKLTLNDAEDSLDDTEQDIIEALGSETLTGEKLASQTGHPYNFKFKSSLSGLRKRGILGNKSPGYFLESEYEFLLKESD